MKNLKKFIVLILSLTFVISLFIVQIGLCAAEEPIKIGYSARALEHRVHVIYVEVCKELAEEDGYEFIYTNSEWDPVKQLADIENMLTMGVNAFIIQSSNEYQLVQAVRKINDEKIPVVTLDSDVAAGKHIFVGVNTKSMGVKSAEYIVEKLNGKGKIIIITGEIGNMYGINFTNGYREVLNKYSDIEIIAEKAGDWRTDKAMKAVEDLLLVHPEVNAILCNNDQMAIGAIEALKNAGYKPGEVMVTGGDGVKAVLPLIKQGWLSATIDKSPYEEAKIAYKTLVAIAKGEFVSCTYSSEGAKVGVEPKIIDVSNVDGFEGY